MDSSDLLLVGAEIGVALAGFAGIIATFQLRDDKTIRRGDVVGLSMIVQMSLGCALLCIIPLVLSVIRVDEATVWAVCSGIGAIYTSYSSQSIHRNMRGATRKKSLRLLFGAFHVGFACVVLAQILNVMDLVFHREPGPYLIGITLGLALVGYMFGRLLLRPLWIRVREQEASNFSGATSN